MVHSRDEIDMARRHIREGEARVVRQQELLDELTADGQPTELARQLLEALQQTLDQMRVHLAYMMADRKS